MKKLINYLKSIGCYRCKLYIDNANALLKENANNLMIYGIEYEKTLHYQSNELRENIYLFKAQLINIIFRLKLNIRQ